MIKALLLTLLITLNIFASDMQMQNREFSTKDMKSQNREIANLAATEINKSLPQKIDKYTTLKSAKADGATIVYIYELNIAPKTDEAVKKEDHSRMKEAVTRGTCASSKRFLEADIALRYVYISTTSKKELFRFDIKQKSCFKI